MIFVCSSSRVIYLNRSTADPVCIFPFDCFSTFLFESPRLIVRAESFALGDIQSSATIAFAL